MSMRTESFAMLGLGVGILLFALLIILAVYVVNAIGLYKIFKKVGHSKPWAGFVPYFNDWTLVEVSGCHWWYFLIIIGNSIIALFTGEEVSSMLSLISGLLSLVSIYVIFCVNYNVAKKFNQGVGFAVGMTLVPIVFYLILGFSDKYQYNANVEVNAWGYYDFDKKVADNKKAKNYCSDCGSEMSGNFCPKCGKKGE